MVLTGSPGARWINANAIRVTPKTTGIICNSLFMMYHIISNQPVVWDSRSFFIPFASGIGNEE